MTATIINGAPMVQQLGTQDLSKKQVPAVPNAVPTHYPFFYIYAQQGPTTPVPASGDALTQIFGANSFDMRQPWATHATAGLATSNAEGNVCMVQRVQPSDAAPPASMRVYLDVLATEVTIYARNSDGSVQLDSSGDPVPAQPAATTPGFSVKWVVAPVPSTGPGSGFGAGTIIPGDQTGTNSVQSQRYPIFDIVASSFGNWGNNSGVRIWAPTDLSTQPIDPTLLAQGVYPIRMAVVSRTAANASATIVPTLSGDQYLDACLAPGTINAQTQALVYAGNTFIPAYAAPNQKGYTPIYGNFGQFKVYDANIQTLLTEFYNAEKTFFNSFSDMTGVGVSEMYLFNFLGGTSSQGVPYTSYQIITTAPNSAVLSPNSNLWASGGSDGTMNEQLFATSVGELITEWADPTSPLQDMATYPVSIFYDTGFPTATKKLLPSFIAARKDTFVVLSTFDTSLPALTASEDSSLGASLLTYLQQYPESEFFGTPVCRGMVIGRSGNCIGVPNYPNALPLTLQVIKRASAYMGASNGIWIPSANFDSLDTGNGDIDMFTDISVVFTPASVRNSDWANGLNWVQAYQRDSYFFPALKTVYNNDTSVLTSFFTCMGICELEKVGYRAWQQFTGTSSLTEDQFVDRVQKWIVAAVQGRFDNRFTIIPVVTITDSDEQRGYSWTTTIQIYADSMKTVQTLILQSYRSEDLPTS